MNNYQLKITPCELSIRPYFGYMPKIRLFAFLFVLIFGLLPFFHTLLTTDIVRIVLSLGGVLLFYTIYDYLFNVKTMFLFDKRTRSIYKITGLIFKKRLMAFDEMTILTSSEAGLMTYSIGRKKKQFEKNYSISDTFSNSKKSLAREKEYVENILNPILQFIKD